MDSYYFEYSDQSNSGYGLCDKVILRQNEIVFQQNINVWMILLQ